MKTTLCIFFQILFYTLFAIESITFAETQNSDSIIEEIPTTTSTNFLQTVREKYIGDTVWLKTQDFLFYTLLKEQSKDSRISAIIDYQKNKPIVFLDFYYDGDSTKGIWSDIQLSKELSTGIDTLKIFILYIFNVPGANDVSLETFEKELDFLFYITRPEERLKDLKKKFGNKFAQSIHQGSLKIGMSKSMVLETIGSADDKNQVVMNNGIIEEWIYYDVLIRMLDDTKIPIKNLYFYNDSLFMWQQ